jgi:Tol biopolymer transport system component
VQVSRDGARVAYTVVNNDAAGRPYSQLWIMELASGKTVRVGGDWARGGGPVWSSDSTRVAFNGRIGDQSGLIVVGADGSAPEFLAPMTGTNSSALLNVGNDIAWSPDGRRLAFVSSTPRPEAGIADGDPMVIERYLYKRRRRKATPTSTTTDACICS